jgi:hypothetical protein
VADEIRYLPPDIASGLRRSFRMETDPADLRWRIERLLERAYSVGYTAGFERGTNDAREDEADERQKLRSRIAGVEGERDSAEDSLALIREQLGVADEVGWMNRVQERLASLLGPRTEETVEAQR